MTTADRIVDAALGLGEQKSWEAVRLHDVAASLDITLYEVRACFREKEDIVDAWFERADGAMLKAAQAPGFSQLAPGRRLHRLIMAWLGALHPYRRTTREMIHGKLEPGHLHVQIPGLLRVSRTVQWMREAASRDAVHLQRALEETGLTAIYLATFLHWMRDDSAGSAKTSGFLERCLAGAEGLHRLIYTRGDSGPGKDPGSV